MYYFNNSILLSPDFSFSSPDKVGEQIQFSNLSLNSDKYNWDFGDGLNSIDKDPIHVYKKPGKYLVTLNAEGEGGSSSTSRSINVTGITYSIINTTGVICNNLCSFYFNGTGIEDLVEHGTLSTMRSTDIVITDKTEIYISLTYSYYTLYSANPFILTVNKHNDLKITSNTLFYGEIKKAGNSENLPSTTGITLNELILKLEDKHKSK